MPKTTKKAWRAAVVKLAQDAHHCDELEVDSNAKVSGDRDDDAENGAFVQAWVWVDFSGTALDKDGGK